MRVLGVLFPTYHLILAVFTLTILRPIGCLIEKILLIGIIIYLIISHNKKNNKEHFAVTDDIRAAVKEIYNTDIIKIKFDFILNNKLDSFYCKKYD